MASIFIVVVVLSRIKRRPLEIYSKIPSSHLRFRLRRDAFPVPPTVISHRMRIRLLISTTVAYRFSFIFYKRRILYSASVIVPSVFFSPSFVVVITPNNFLHLGSGAVRMYVAVASFGNFSSPKHLWARSRLWRLR